MISARGLGHSFPGPSGPREVLSGIDLRVEPGETVCLMGANGSGKTTLLKILGTFLIPEKGSLTAFGLDAAARPRDVRRRLGFVFSDDRGFYGRLSALENRL